MHYLDQFFVSKESLLKEAKVTQEQIDELIQYELVPNASYILTEKSSVQSFIFGESSSIEEQIEYFHKSTLHWIKNAQKKLENLSLQECCKQFKEEFLHNYEDALVAHGVSGQEKLEQLKANTWKHFLKGTYGVCVIDPSSEANIAAKQMSAQRLTNLTEDGTKQNYTENERELLQLAITTYNQFTADFAPWDLLLSGRARLLKNTL